MRIASILAGFSLGQADILRRAMGKKNESEMKRMREVFQEGAVKNGLADNNAGMIINSSRGIIYAGDGPDFAQDARKATEELRDAINQYR